MTVSRACPQLLSFAALRIRSPHQSTSCCTARHKHQSAPTPNPIPATYLRGGTSKGIFLNRKYLPEDPDQWAPIFLGIMGSPDPEHRRQLNGMGGGVSSLSKVCVVGAPSDVRAAQGIDVEYTFVQVGIADSTVDYTGNCGNLSSVVGVFAVDEGLCKPRVTGRRATVRAFNTNTDKLVDTTFPVADTDLTTPVLDLQEATVAGVPGKASEIVL
jgi:2-methylaconitate cis-trans-isomerase PrpF